jgi:group I intron endonuclease
MREVICGIYKIENLINGKLYFGQSIDIYNRWYDHQYLLDSDKHYNKHLQSAWNYYTKENFKFSIIEVCDTESLDIREKYYIELYNTYDPVYGYNLTMGGEGGTPNIETRSKMANSHLGLLGTEESRAKQSAALSGVNNPMFGCKGELSPTYGRIKSKEEIEKMMNTRWTEEKRKINSQRVSGKNNPMFGRSGSQNPASKAVVCVETEEYFETVRQAAKWCGLKAASMIGQVCLGKRNVAGRHPETGEKLHWKYAEDIANQCESNEIAL